LSSLSYAYLLLAEKLLRLTCSLLTKLESASMVSTIAVRIPTAPSSKLALAELVTLHSI